jgi:hypothetical protein
MSATHPIFYFNNLNIYLIFIGIFIKSKTKNKNATK